MSKAKIAGLVLFCISCSIIPVALQTGETKTIIDSIFKSIAFYLFFITEIFAAFFIVSVFSDEEEPINSKENRREVITMIFVFAVGFFFYWVRETFF
jgi:hypothetical protein